MKPSRDSADSVTDDRPQTTDRAFLPYGRHCVDEDDIAAVAKVLRGEFLTTGPTVAAFESALASKVGADFAIACANGTAALHLAVLGLGIGPGDVCVVPAVTFLATATACRLAGAGVIFADVNPDTGLMDVDDLTRALSRTAPGRTRAVLPVHLAGQCADMAGIQAVARRHGLYVIEDACHAIGGEQAGTEGPAASVGACRFSDLAAFSFHPVKTIAMGEGGAVTTNDAALADRIGTLRNHGMIRAPEAFRNADLARSATGDANPWYYEMHQPGLNYRASDIHCALGLSQLQKLPGFVEQRARLVALYDAALTDLAPVVRPLQRQSGNLRTAWHLYVVLIDFAALGVDRANVMNALRASGIGTQVHYIPLPLQPYYGQNADDFPGAMRYYDRCLSLPLFPGMDEDDVAYVAQCLRRIVGAS